MKRCALVCLAAIAMSSAAAAAEDPSMTPQAIAADTANFSSCLAGLWPMAAQRHVARDVFERELAGMTPEVKLLDYLRVQPEFERPLWDYVTSLVTDQRIAQGQVLLKENEALLARIEAKFGVDRYTLVALWGIESNYGKGMGERSIIRSSATLACLGRRKPFFRAQLVAALAMVSRGDLPATRLKGSWAGAFGHTQVLPTTFLANAVDFEGNGHRNPIDSIADALATTANILKKDGWETGKSWGYEVVLPAGFDYRLAAGERRLTVAQWQKLGVRRVGERPFPRQGDVASLALPAGARGPVFLVMRNFRALQHYNGSEAYAFALGHLADRLRGGAPFVRPWPTDLRPLSRGERQEMQQLLSTLGFDPGNADGRISGRTRDAVRAFQLRVGMLPDGYPTADVLKRLRNNVAAD